MGMTMKRITPPAAPLTIYTNYTYGSDSNDGIFAPKKTVQNALETILNGYDPVTLQEATPITIRMADNVTDANGVHFAPHGQLLHGTAGICIEGGVGSVLCGAEFFYGAVVRLKNLKLARPSGAGLLVARHAAAYLSNVEFGACAIQLQQTMGAVCELEGPVTISGSAGQFHNAGAGCSFSTNSNAINITSDLSFGYFVISGGGGCDLSYSGSQINLNGHTVTGQRYLASLNAVLRSGDGSETFFPGSTDGQAIYGGCYV